MSARLAPGELAMASGYVSGLIGDVVELHARYYAANWGFERFFEAKVAAELAEFMQRYEPTRDCIWHVQANQRVAASITIDGVDAAGAGAHLRWFIVGETLRGRGAGSALIDEALGFCRERAFPRVYLWTFGGLDAARRLYERAGFQLTETRAGTTWGRQVEEQRFELVLG